MFIDKLKKLVSKFKKKKRPAVVLLSIFIITVFTAASLLITEKTKKQEKESPPPSHTKTQERFVPKTSPKPESATAGTFILNSVNTLPGVINYSWHENALVYSTPTGIYKAGTNSRAVSLGIEYINFNPNGFAIFQSGGVWHLYNPSTSELETLPIQAEQPILNKEANLIADFSGKEIRIADLSKNEAVVLKQEELIERVIWVYEKNWIAVEKSSENEKAIELFDTDLQSQYKLALAFSAKLLDISPNSSYLAYTVSGNVIVKSTSDESKTVYEFEENSTFSGNWISNNELVIIETTPRDEIGRKTDVIWKITSSDTKSFIANSNPVPRKLDTAVKLFANQPKTVLPLVENKNTLWLVSLVPNTLPVYTKNGLVLSPAPLRQEEF